MLSYQNKTFHCQDKIVWDSLILIVNGNFQCENRAVVRLEFFIPGKVVCMLKWAPCGDTKGALMGFSSSWPCSHSSRIVSSRCSTQTTVAPSSYRNCWMGCAQWRREAPRRNWSSSLMSTIWMVTAFDILLNHSFRMKHPCVTNSIAGFTIWNQPCGVFVLIPHTVSRCVNKSTLERVTPLDLLRSVCKSDTVFRVRMARMTLKFKVNDPHFQSPAKRIITWI